MDTKIVSAADCFECEECGELVCPVCRVHYTDCPCPGPDSEDDEMNLHDMMNLHDILMGSVVRTPYYGYLPPFLEATARADPGFVPEPDAERRKDGFRVIGILGGITIMIIDEVAS